MSKHKMVDGRLLQMNKSFGQLKQKQREKIAEWMYQAYKKQVIADFFLDGFGIGKMSEDHIQQNIEFRILRGEK